MLIKKTDEKYWLNNKQTGLVHLKITIHMFWYLHCCPICFVFIQWFIYVGLYFKKSISSTNFLNIKFFFVLFFLAVAILSILIQNLPICTIKIDLCMRQWQKEQQQTGAKWVFYAVCQWVSSAAPSKINKLTSQIEPVQIIFETKIHIIFFICVTVPEKSWAKMTCK